MNEVKDIFKKRFCIVIAGILLAWAVGATIAWRICLGEYSGLQSAIDSANSGELQRQLGSVTAELERVRAALSESEQSVGRLTELDRRRDEGFRRIGGILEDTGRSISGVTGGEQRTRIALEAIARIASELEKQFDGSAE